MVYMDTPQKNIYATVGPRFKLGQMFCHISADTEEELVAFAKRVGFPVRWLQHSGLYSFHFDCTGSWMKKFLARSDVVKLSKEAFIGKLAVKRARLAAERNAAEKRAAKLKRRFQ